MGSSKNNSKSSSSQTYVPPPQLKQAYSDLITRAQGVANQPLQLYQGQMVAGFTPDQQQAFTGIENAQGIQTPYLNAATNYANQGATPITPTQFSAGAVDQYMSPYTQDVVNATQRQFGEMNAEAQNQLTGNQIAAGGYGGDRSAVAAAQLARQQSIAQDPIIAQLYSQGYGQALGEFNTQQQARMQAQEASAQNALNAGYQMGGLGNEALSTALTGASALNAAGGEQQQLEQENLNVPYEQYLQTMAYPYQQTGFLEGVLGGVGQNMGYTTKGSTSQNGKSSSFSLAGGGRAPEGHPYYRHYDTGGNIYSLSGAPQPPYWMELSPFYGVGQTPMAADKIGPSNPAAGYVPQTPNYVPQSSGAPQSANMMNAGTPNQQGQNSGQGAGLLNGLASGFKAIDSLNASPSFNSTMGGIGDAFSSIGSSLADAGSAALAFFGLEHGGRAHHLDDGGTSGQGGASDPNDLYRDMAMGDSGYWADPGMSRTDRTMGAGETPDEWRGQATHFAAQPPHITGGHLYETKPGEESFWQRIGLAPEISRRTDGSGYDYDPGWGRAVLQGLGAAATSGHLLKGVAEAVTEHDLDRKPELDHSGPTTTVRYNDGTEIDTGLPTEASINAQAMNAYRSSSLDERSQAMNLAHEDRVEREHDEAMQRQTLDELRRQNLQNTKEYHDSEIGMQRDREADMQESRQTKGALTWDNAYSMAQKDYDRFYRDQYGDYRAPPKNGMQGWIQQRATAYMGQQGGAGVRQMPQQTGTEGVPPQSPRSPVAPVPPAPIAHLPGLQWSPSRRQYRDATGKIYDQTGRPLQ